MNVAVGTLSSSSEILIISLTKFIEMKYDDARFNVVLFPLSLCPSNNTFTGFPFFFSAWLSAAIRASISSLRFLANASALMRAERASGVSSMGGAHALRNGSLPLLSMEDLGCARPIGVVVRKEGDG